MEKVMLVGSALIAACLAAVLFYLMFLATKKRKAVQMLRVSGIHQFPHWSPLGNTQILLQHLTTTTKMANFVLDIGSKYPKGVSLWKNQELWIIMPDLEVIEAILSSPDAVEKPQVYQLFNDFTQGVYNAPTEKWRKLRKKLNPTFSNKMLDDYMEDVNGRAQIFMNNLKGKENYFFDVSQSINCFFFDLITGTHFAAEANEQENPKLNVIEACGQMLKEIIELRFYLPLMRIDFFYHMTRTYRRIIRTRDALFKSLEQILNAGAQKQEKNAKSSGNGEQIRINYSLLVKEALTDMRLESTPFNVLIHCADLFIAGSDTSAVTLSTLLYHLALDPEEQERLWHEAVSVPTPVTRRHLDQLTRLDMAVREAARLCCPPGVTRCLTRSLSVGGYMLPKGANVYLAISAVHRDPRYWERPLSFHPDHFLPERVEARPRKAFLPFSAGPRNCPGSAYAYMSIKRIAWGIIRQYRLETNLPAERVKRRVVLMLEHENGYPIKFIPRSPPVTTPHPSFPIPSAINSNKF